MAKNNPVMLAGLEDLLGRIRGDVGPGPLIHNDFFDHDKGTQGMTFVQYIANGYTFEFTKESVSYHGQRPPYIHYKLRCVETRGRLTVYVTYPIDQSVETVRKATWAAFRAFKDLSDTATMETIDARGYCQVVTQHA